MLPTTRALLAGVSAAVLSVGLAAPPSASAFGNGSFAGSLLRGSAHGGTVGVTNAQGTVVSAGPLAKQSLGCNPALGSEGYKDTDGATSELNYLGNVALPIPSQVDALDADQIRNSGYATADDAAAHVYERSTVAAVNILGGYVTGTALQMSGHTRLDASGYASDADLVVQDLYVDADGPGPLAPVHLQGTVGPNTTYSLGALGSVVLNEQTVGATGIDANAIHLRVADFYGWTGDIVVAHVETMLSVSPARISGFAYGTQAKAAPVASSGKQALANLPCSGTWEKDKVVTGAGVTVQGASPGTPLMVAGTITDIVNAKTSPTSPYSRSTSRVQDLRLLVDSSGVPRVSADVVQTRAYTFAGFDRRYYDADGSKPPIPGIRSVGSMQIANLVVDGHALTLDPQAVNQTVDLPGLGTLVVNEQRCRDARTGGNPYCDSWQSGTETHYGHLTVVGLHLLVTVPGNNLGLPVGAEVQVAVAHSDLSF